MWRSEARREPLAQGLRYGTKKNICIKQSCQNTLPVSATIVLPVQGARWDSRATTAYNDFFCTRHGLYTNNSIDAALSQRRLNPSTPFQKQTPCRFSQQRPTAHWASCCKAFKQPTTTSEARPKSVSRQNGPRPSPTSCSWASLSRSRWPTLLLYEPSVTNRWPTSN